jgi:hypothetical protein
MARLETTGRGSKDILARARSAIHTFDTVAIKRAAEPALAENESARK